MNNIELGLAIEIMLNSIQEVKDVEILNTRDSLNRILAEDIFAPMNNPPFDKSPLDGFAIRGEDTENALLDNPIEFKVIDTIYAGATSKKTVGQYEAIRIMTGSKMPQGSNAVIRLEDVLEDKYNININKSIKPFSNYCYKGEDIKFGELLMTKYTPLNAIHLGVLSSMGIQTVKVIRKPVVGVLVTGDEVTEIGGILEDGKIYDSNEMLLCSRLSELGINYIKLDKKKDNIEEVCSSIDSNIEELDLLITTGGVSVGDKDIFHGVIEQLGAKQLFWRVSLQPGTPLMYSIFKNKPILSLSGNPFASLATFEVLARPLISKLSSDLRLQTKRVKAILLSDFNKVSKKRRFIRAIYNDGEVLLPYGGHSSGMLLSMANCNALVDIEAGNKGIKEGSTVDVILL